MTGVDVFRLNFSHGSHAEHAERFKFLRALEAETGRPIAILAGPPGPGLHVGSFPDGPVMLAQGQAFRLDLDTAAGNAQRVELPHPEIFAALAPGAELLLDDGKLRLVVERCGADFADTRVAVGGRLSEHKGVNVPGVLLPITALTEKDRVDLTLALELGADWIALSFVQRPEDVSEARALIGDRAAIVVKLEKPAAVDCLDEIVALSDAVMVARGGPRRRTAGRTRAGHPETHRAALPRCRQAGDRGHADAGVDGRKPRAHTRRSLGRGHCDLRRCRCGDAVGRIGGGPLPGADRRHDEPHHRAG